MLATTSPVLDAAPSSAPFYMLGASNYMYVWDLRMPETAHLDDAQLHDALGKRRRILRRYRLGAMAVHDGMSYHQVAPMEDPKPGEMRITLQGHGVPVDGVMRLFW